MGVPEPIENLRQVRLEKLKKIRELGIDPYPSGWENQGSRSKNQELRDLALGTGVTAAGRIVGWRDHGKIIFADLQDGSGEIQLALKNGELTAKGWQLTALLDLGDFIGVSGKLFQTNAGELTIEVSDFTLLAKSIRPLPSTKTELKDPEECYRRRYLDLLMNPESKKVFETRTRVLSAVRGYLDSAEFVEVETPVLQPLYGGASAKPFTTHLDALDCDLYLRIADELYLKRLIVGGFEKVYEVSKDFRNEGIDRQHSPEFTQVEFYWAYADYEMLMEFTEKLFSSVIEQAVGGLKIEFEGETLDFTPPFKRVTYRDLVLEHTRIDIDEAKTEDKLRAAVAAGPRPANELDLSGTVGYGALLDEIYKTYCRPKVIQPTYLIDHPAETVALAKRTAYDPSKVARFQLLASGYELCNAYTELNDPLDQKERWQEQEKLAAKGLEEHENLDEDYIEALEYGMPPTAGIGIGIDRLTAILTDSHTIRDVILFPLMRPRL